MTGSDGDGAAASPAERRFTLKAGVVVGRVHDGVVRALGIPYARATRFSPPVPVSRYERPVNAFTRAPAAPQLPPKLLSRLIGDDNLDPDEDCQRLSVTAPIDVSADTRLPVLVWIHGGGYVAGAGDLAQHDPRRLVAEQRVIVVAVTYRLGMLGFLGDGADVPPNLGLLDLLTALRWVRDNIDAFGGDPDAITVFGRSSGADAIAHLMISNGAEGLFQRAILQSAPLGITAGRAPMTEAMCAAVGDLSRTAGRDHPRATAGRRAGRAAVWGVRAHAAVRGAIRVFPLAGRGRPGLRMASGSTARRCDDRMHSGRDRGDRGAHPAAGRRVPCARPGAHRAAADHRTHHPEHV
ncbi:hypothetical protein MPUL_37720 [Mycolicibacterium pulveris]|uniref:Carboxylic ester hydrolase n=1 Tax=Mycolicibacterium pulveris TaxID=36813 RepID=A0A7I7UMA1_MYCPV|nr:hypothetical protein MPUL_37720 [Mycolicibacterium pulveris]